MSDVRLRGWKHEDIEKVPLSQLIEEMSRWCDERGLYEGDVGYSGTINVSVASIRYLHVRAKELESRAR